MSCSIILFQYVSDPTKLTGGRGIFSGTDLVVLRG
jgi:hypothetical protein